MITFNEFMDNIDEVNHEPYDSNSQHLATSNIENIEVLYQKAMRTKSPAELKKVMLAMKNKFSDAKNIQFNKISWTDIYQDINESVDAKKSIEGLNKDIDKAIENKDTKYLDILTKELDKILKALKK